MFPIVQVRRAGGLAERQAAGLIMGDQDVLHRLASICLPPHFEAFAGKLQISRSMT
jgi:hypothetical protein